MKLIYITSMFPFGPMEAFFVPETMELLRTGHSLLVVPTRPRGAVIHRDAAEVVAVTIRQSVASIRVLFGAFLEAVRSPVRSARAAALLCRSRTPRILAKNVVVFPKGLWVSRLARRCGADHIHAQWASTSSTIGLVASTVSGVPWSFTAHRWDIAENNLLATKVGTASFARVISVRGSRELAQYVGSAQTNVKVIHMGVPLSPIHSGVSGRSILRVIVAANLREVKGHQFLIEAMRLARERGIAVEADFAGGGPLRRALERQVAEAKLDDRVKFLGVVAHRELLDGMQNGRWDAAVLPSIAVSESEQEGIPVFLMEAMACGVPVVGTHTGGVSELVEGVGLLVPDRDAESLARALSRLATEAPLRNELSIAGRRRVEEQFGIESVVRNLVAEMAAASGDTRKTAHATPCGKHAR